MQDCLGPSGFQYEEVKLCKQDKGQFTQGPKLPSPTHMLASPNMGAKSQLLSLKKSLKYGLLSLKLDLDYFIKNDSRDLCWI
jgi:hypothetical protein